jgi:uncharacterized protein YqfA (UPF0365 family)
MKNKVLIIVGLLLVIAGLALADVKYEQRHREQVRQQQVLQQQIATNTAKVVELNKEVTADRDALLAQCKVGVDSWAKLTPVQQKTQPKPDCELSFR